MQLGRAVVAIDSTVVGGVTGEKDPSAQLANVLSK